MPPSPLAGGASEPASVVRRLVLSSLATAVAAAPFWVSVGFTPGTELLVQVLTLVALTWVWSGERWVRHAALPLVLVVGPFAIASVVPLPRDRLLSWMLVAMLPPYATGTTRAPPVRLRAPISLCYRLILSALAGAAAGWAFESFGPEAELWAHGATLVALTWIWSRARCVRRVGLSMVFVALALVAALTLDLPRDEVLPWYVMAPLPALLGWSLAGDVLRPRRLRRFVAPVFGALAHHATVTASWQRWAVEPRGLATMGAVMGLALALLHVERPFARATPKPVGSRSTAHLAEHAGQPAEVLRSTRAT